MRIDSLLFVAFNKRVAALDRRNGEIVWDWKAPTGSGFVSLLLDRDLLFAAVQGYTYALDPRSGAELWCNPMKGFGFGITSLASVSGQTPGVHAAQVEADEQAAAAANQPATG